MKNQLRPGLDPLPHEMRNLHIDERGYPVPAFVAWVDGKPDHRVVNPERFVDCLENGLCWICGNKCGRNLFFVGGPACMLNRVSSEPASHLMCAFYAVKNCPFLVRPNAKRRDTNLPDGTKFPEGSIKENAGVVGIYHTRSASFSTQGSGVLLSFGEPVAITWYTEGRHATKAEVDAAIALAVEKTLEVCISQSDRDTVQERLAGLQNHIPAASGELNL